MDENGQAFVPAGAPSYPFHLPDQVTADAPQCITRVEFITQNKRLTEAESVNRIADLYYLVGNYPTSPASKGVKGKHGRAAQMITDMPRWRTLMAGQLDRFQREWMERNKSYDSSEPGFDGRSMTFEQAWCKELMRRRLTIRAGAWANVPEPRRYRIRVCPEAPLAAKLARGEHLTAFMRELMRRVENDLGAYFPERTRPLIWIGAGHYLPKIAPDWVSAEERSRWDEKPSCHAHFAVRGVDTMGRVLWFERLYVHSPPHGTRRSGLENRARGLLQEFFDGTGYAKTG